MRSPDARAFVLFAGPSFTGDSLADVVAMAKKEPGSLRFASPGTSATQHLAMERFKGQLGLDIPAVIY